MPKTHSNPLTKEQIELLRSTNYVKKVSSSTVIFTESFKRAFYEKYKSGSSLRDTFISFGIDPAILGKSRMEGFRYTLNKYAKRENGFSDNRQKNYHRLPQTGEKTVETRIKQLEHELAYTRQEVEFLKKLQMADMEARRQWESKHQQK